MATQRMWLDIPVVEHLKNEAFSKLYGFSSFFNKWFRLLLLIRLKFVWELKLSFSDESLLFHPSHSSPLIKQTSVKDKKKCWVTAPPSFFDKFTHVLQVFQVPKNKKSQIWPQAVSKKGQICKCEKGQMKANFSKKLCHTYTCKYVK